MTRPPEETFIEKYYGLKFEDVTERSKINTDYGDLVNLLTMFKDMTKQDLEDKIFVLEHRMSDLKKAYELEQEENIRLVEELEIWKSRYNKAAFRRADQDGLDHFDREYLGKSHEKEN